MTRRSRTLLQLAALAAVLAVLGALAWFVVRGKSQRELERADNPKVELPADGHVDISAESTPLEARSAEKGDAATGAVSAAPGSTGVGTLHVRVLDEQTRSPVPDLRFVVYRERGGPKNLATGTTDKNGRAELPEIEANTVIVRTERRPPYAEQSGAVWLTPGATKEVELLLGPGGAFVGRVVDDLGRPVEAAQLCADIWLEPQEPTTSTGADGRFRVECLSSRPSSVWVVGGAMRPEHWELVWIGARLGKVFASARGTPVPGKDVDVGDLVLARASSYAGRLFDANGELVDGALVGMSAKRELGPADPGFELRPGEVLTSGGGRFVLADVPQLTTVDVWTRDGRRQQLRMPPAKPGERLEGVELRLLPEVLFELEFVDANGAAPVIPAPVKGSKGSDVAQWQARFWTREWVSVLVRTADGARERRGCERPDADGKWRLRIPLDPRSIGEFEVVAAGYAPLAERSTTGFPALVQRKLTLMPHPAFHLRLAPKDTGAQRLAPPGERVVVQICMADPARHVAAKGKCCGLGAHWNELWDGAPLELVLLVRRQAPYWIYVRGPRPDDVGVMRSLGYTGDMLPAGICDVARYGPFEPGPDMRELELDSKSFVRPKQAVEPRKPPEPSAPSEKPVASLRAHVTDARTGKPIKNAWIAVGGASATADENGDVKSEQLPVGTLKVRISARGYQSMELGERTTRTRETLDLGSIGLEPFARRRGRILGADGPAPGRVWVGIVAGSGSVNEENGGMGAEADGSFDLIGELPPSFVLQVVAPVMHAGRGGLAQRFVLEPWPEDEVKELRFVAARKVIVAIEGIDPEGAELVPYVCPAPGEPTARCDHSLREVAPHEPLSSGLRVASTGEGPRYAFLLAPGRYQVYGSILMHELPLTEFEVTAGETDIELTIQAR